MFENNIQEASLKLQIFVKLTFDELQRFPEIYISISKAFSPIKVTDVAVALPDSESALFAQISAAEQELEKTSESIVRFLQMWHKNSIWS